MNLNSTYDTMQTKNISQRKLGESMKIGLHRYQAFFAYIESGKNSLESQILQLKMFTVVFRLKINQNLF